MRKQSYLGELIENGMIEFDALDRKYRTTMRGIEYLRAMERISDILTMNTRRSVAGKKSMEVYQF